MIDHCVIKFISSKFLESKSISSISLIFCKLNFISVKQMKYHVRNDSRSLEIELCYDSDDLTTVRTVKTVIELLRYIKNIHYLLRI